MQQTADALTKDQTDVDAETILVSGLSYFFYAVAVILGVLAVADVAMTAACGSSSCYSSVVVLATQEAAAVADATICAANC